MNIAASGKAFVRSQILPRPVSGARPSLMEAPLVVAGMFRTGNGIGRAARSCFEALEREGFLPKAVDTSGLLNQAHLAPAVPLSQLDPGILGTLILFANPPEIERCLMALGLRRWHRWRIIGAWAWETPVAPAHWQRQTSFVSEIWAPSRFVADAFEAAYNRPVHNVPHYVKAAPEADTSGTVQDNPGQSGTDNLHILTLADARSSLTRKNPVAAVKMFREAFPENAAARLTVKCRNLDLFPGYAADLRETAGGDARIHLLEQTLTDAEHAALIEACDILLSPHRSEGFGLPLAEAMAAGKCVVATGWSGNMEFMAGGGAVLLPFSLVPVADPTGVYAAEPGAVWAEPVIDAGVEALRSLALDPARRAMLGQEARRAIADTLHSRPYRNALEAP